MNRIVDLLSSLMKPKKRDFSDVDACTAGDERKSIRDAKIKRVREFVLADYHERRYHGIDHWDRVYANGQQLITRKVNPLVIGLFAYLHDYCREDDGDDLQHGPRAAEFIDTVRDTLLMDVNDKDIHLLKEACRLHTVVDRTGNPTIDACFDADRLDLGRVGIIPDPARMATKKGKEIANSALSW